MAKKTTAKQKNTRFLLRRITVPMGVAIVGLLTPVAFGFAVLALSMALQEPRVLSQNEESSLRGVLFDQFKSDQAADAQSCPEQPTLDDQHKFERDNIRINRSGDRAIIRFCNETGSLLAKTSNNIWFRLSSIDPRPEANHDYDTREICKIEDITLGFNDTSAETLDTRTNLQNDCRNVDAAYARLLEQR